MIGELGASLMPDRVHLRDRPSVTLLRPVLQLTVYFEPTLEWAHTTAPSLLRSFLALRSHSPPRLFRVASDARWRPLPDPVEELIDALPPSSFGTGLRPGFRLRVVDHPDAPSHAFVYREHDPRVGAPCGYMQVTLPTDRDPEELVALAIEIAQTAPIDQALAGYAWSWNEQLPRNAFGAVARRAERYLGVDVQHPDAASWHAHEVLLGAGWLTLIGGRLSRALGLDLDRAAATLRSPEVGATCMSLQHALLIRAGAAPEVGDVNAMELPLAQARVTAALAPHLGGDEPALPGVFSEPETPEDHPPEGRTAAWRRRLLSADAQPDAPPPAETLR